MLAGGVELMAFAKLVQLALEPLVDGDRGDEPDRAVVLEQVDHAQVGERPRRQPGDAGEGLGHIQRLRQRDAGVDQQRGVQVLVRARLLPRGACGSSGPHARVPPRVCVVSASIT